MFLGKGRGEGPSVLLFWWAYMLREDFVVVEALHDGSLFLCGPVGGTITSSLSAPQSFYRSWSLPNPGSIGNAK